MADPIIEGLKAEGLLTQSQAAVAEADLNFTGEDGSTGTWIDADTIQMNDGRNYRLSGYDAAETAKFGFEFDDAGNPVGTKFDKNYVKTGQVGGAEQTAALADLARKQGYTRVVPTGRTDAYGREIVDLANAAGSRFGDELVATDILGGDKYTSDLAHQNTAMDWLWNEAVKASGGEQNDMNVAARQLKDVVEESGGMYTGQLRERAWDEADAVAAKEAAKKYGVANPYYEDAVDYRSRDRNYANEAINPLSVAWDSGLEGVVEGAAGLLELVGHESGWEGLESYAEGWKEEIQYDLSQAPSIIVDYKDVEGTGDFIEYVGNMAAMSLPYMAVTIGGAALAPVTGGLSLTAPAGIYAGQTWNEMGDTDETEKNAVLAIGAGISMAALDRLGIKGLSNTALMTKQGQKEVVEALVKKGMTEQAARAHIPTVTRRVAAELTGEAAKFAKQQLKAKAVINQLLTKAGKQSAQEGITEVGQETIGYLAAVAGSDKVFDANELADRLTNAAIGGSVLGGAFSVPGTAYNTGAWTDIAYRLAPANEEARAKQNRWASEAQQKDGYVKSNKEIALEAEQEYNRRKQSRFTPTSVNDRAAEAQKTKEGRSFVQATKEAMENIPGLWRGSVRHIFKDETQDRSVAARKLASLYGGHLQRVYSGATFENAKHLRLAEYKNLIHRPLEVLQSFGVQGVRKADQQKVSDLAYAAFEAAEKTGDKVNWDSLVGTDYEQHIPALKALDADMRRLTDKLYEDQKRYNPELGKLSNYGWRHKSLDKKKIEKNQHAFTQTLIKEAKLDERTAKDLVNAILNIDGATDIQSAFSLLEQGGFKPGSHKGRTLNLSDNAAFTEYLSNDLFRNLSDSAKSAARYVTYNEFTGPNNSVVDQLLDEMEQELIASGLTPAEAKSQTDVAALGLKNYFDAESGNYKRPTTDFGRNMQALQKNFMFITTLSSLPLATISSFVELGLTLGGLEKKDLNGWMKSAKTEAEAMVKNFQKDKEFETAGRKVLRETGFFEWEVGAATVTGVSEVSNIQQDMLESFFKVIGLKQWTDFTRAVRGSIAADYLAGKTETYINRDPKNLTNEDIEAEDALRNLGVDPERFSQVANTPVDARTPEDQAYYDSTIREATFQFINDAVVLPQTSNRPLFYQDPRWALFTQFHGFISAFQANVLPKLYRQAFKGQTPSMKYNAFAVMSTMIMLGFLSQYLKDLIKYGKPSPYLQDTDQFLQRGVGASGLLGVGERAFNLVNPLYESRYDTTADWAFDTITGESAAISKGKQAIDAFGKVAEGDLQTGLERGLKFAPGVGPLTGLRKAVADWTFGE